MTALAGRPAAAGALALDGGTPVRSGPFPSRPAFDSSDVEAAEAVLRSGRVNYWTGEEGHRFEAEFAEWVGVDHCVAVANGTVALELALRALGVGRGDEVIVPAATFVATAGAVVAVGASPVVVDVDRDSQCLTVETVASAMTPRTAAVVVVHLAGWAADVADLVGFARARGLAVVEDCAQAHGARRGGRSVGTAGDIAAWSFCQDKIMTTGGEGGAVTTADPELRRHCWELKDHGKSWDAVHRADHPPGFRWVHHRFGTNARITEMQSAVGRSQLRRLPRWVAERRRHADHLGSALRGVPALRLPGGAPDMEHAWYRYWLHVRPDALRPGWDRDRVVEAIRAEGIPVSHGGCTEIHRERAFLETGRVDRGTPVAAELGRTSVVLLVHPTLTDLDVEQTAAAVARVLAVAGCAR